MPVGEMQNISVNVTTNTTTVSDPQVFASIFGVEGYYTVVSVLLATLVSAQLFLSVITIIIKLSSEMLPISVYEAYNPSYIQWCLILFNMEFRRRKSSKHLLL